MFPSEERTVFLCFFRLPDVEKPLRHTSHWLQTIISSTRFNKISSINKKFMVVAIETEWMVNIPYFIPKSWIAYMWSSFYPNNLLTIKQFDIWINYYST